MSSDPRKTDHDPTADRGQRQSGAVEPSGLPVSRAGGQSGGPIPDSTTPRTSKADSTKSETGRTNGEKAAGDQEVGHTAVRCLSLIARHHGLDAAAARLIHEYSLENEEPSNAKILRIARDLGLKARFSRISWSHLERAQQAFPIMAKLENGNFVILVGMRKAPIEGGKTINQVAVFDPLADRPDFIFLTRESFEKSWRGEVLLAKRTYRLLDQNQPFSLRWFLPEIARQWTTFTDVAIAAVVIQIIALVVPLYFQLVIDKVLVNNAMQTLHAITVGICVALVFDAILNFLRGFLLLHATAKIDVRVATRTFQHMLSLPMTFFEQITAGVLSKHMQQTSKIREFLTGSLFLTLLDTVSLFVFLPIMFLYSVKLTLIVLVFTALLALNIFLLLGPYRRRLEALYNAEGNRQAMLIETIHGAQTVKALSMEPVQRKKWDQRSAEAVAMQYRVGKISIAATTVSKLIEKLMMIAVIWFGATDVINREISVGALIAFQMISGRVTGPLVQLVSLIHSFQETALSVRMLGTVMNSPAEPGVGHGLRPPIQGQIELERVTFSYAPALPPALRDVSLKIPHGSVIGVVGRSGSGKTTLTRLFQGMYAPQAGLIRIDGLDMRELDLTHLRQNIGVVLQDNFLFRGTVRENISMAKSNTSFPEVVHAAKLAGADEFIERLPQSYDTMLEENGSNLSGGQKQRLAIARALLTDPRILVFDEATSALDPESEAIIQRNLAGIARGRTVIIVSHRLTTLTSCDFIVVLERGEISAIGNHRQLLETCKVYRDLWQQQVGRI